MPTVFLEAPRSSHKASSLAHCLSVGIHLSCQAFSDIGLGEVVFKSCSRLLILGAGGGSCNREPFPLRDLWATLQMACLFPKLCRPPGVGVGLGWTSQGLLVFTVTVRLLRVWPTVTFLCFSTQLLLEIPIDFFFFSFLEF